MWQKCYKLRYINKIMLFFEFQKGFNPRNSPRVRHWSKPWQQEQSPISDSKIIFRMKGVQQIAVKIQMFFNL